MKKVFYVVLVIVILLIIGQMVRKPAGVAESEIVTVEKPVAIEENADGVVVVEEENVVVVDHEPTAEEAAAMSAQTEAEDVEETEVDGNVVETDPETTAEEGETIVE